MFLPGGVARCDGYDLNRRGSFRFTHPDNAKWQVICFASNHRDKYDEEFRVGEAAQSGYPILAVSERDRGFPRKLAGAAQLELSCDGLNADIVGRTIKAVLGEPPLEGLDDIDFTRLDLADLSIAIRPGVTPATAVATLRKLSSQTAPKRS